MSDILIVHQFENMIINVFGMHFDFIILHVSTIMEVPLLGLQIGPCLKCLVDWKLFQVILDLRIYNSIWIRLSEDWSSRVIDTYQCKPSATKYGIKCECAVDRLACAVSYSFGWLWSCFDLMDRNYRTYNHSAFWDVIRLVDRWTEKFGKSYDWKSSNYDFTSIYVGSPQPQRVFLSACSSWNKLRQEMIWEKWITVCSLRIHNRSRSFGSYLRLQGTSDFLLWPTSSSIYSGVRARLTASPTKKRF